jgi:hypothetical protein
MGVPVEKLLDMPMYVPRQAFEVIEGNQTAEAFTELHKHIGKVAERFWTLPFEDEDFIRHLGMLQIMTRKAPEISDFMLSQTHEPIPDLLITAHANQIARVPNLAAKSTKKRPKLLDVTYHEAHDNPDIRHAAVKALREAGDSSVEIVRCLEGWRYANDLEAPYEQMEVVRNAYEVYLYSVGQERFLSAIGWAATGYLARD